MKYTHYFSPAIQSLYGWCINQIISGTCPTGRHHHTLALFSSVPDFLSPLNAKQND